MTEIERKFLLAGFPVHLQELENADVWQGYISTRPVVRIRKKRTEKNCTYKLCFKGEGQMARQETEIPIEEKIFEELKLLLKKPLIHKEYRVYDWNGRRLECSRVEIPEEKDYYYGEIEFCSREEALAFQPPAFLGREVTFEKGFTMGELWERMKEI